MDHIEIDLRAVTIICIAAIVVDPVQCTICYLLCTALVEIML